MTYMTNLDAEVRAMSLSMDRPNLAALSHVLRHPEMWPADFRWDYTDCATCAIGLAYKMWMDAGSRTVTEAFGISNETANALFYGVRKPGFDGEMSATSAVNVADAIDRHLASA